MHSFQVKLNLNSFYIGQTTGHPSGMGMTTDVKFIWAALQKTETSTSSHLYYQDNPSIFLQT